MIYSSLRRAPASCLFELSSLPCLRHIAIALRSTSLLGSPAFIKVGITRPEAQLPSLTKPVANTKPEANRDNKQTVLHAQTTNKHTA